MIGMKMLLRTAAAVAVPVLALSGCSRHYAAVPEAVVPSTSPTMTPSYRVPSPGRGSASTRPVPISSPGRVSSVDSVAEALTCRSGERLALGFSGFGAAAGSRGVTLEVLNCTRSAVTVPAMPTLDQASASGARVPVVWGLSDRSAKSRRLAPGASTSWLLEWHTNGDCEHRGARTLTARVGRSTATLTGCLDLGGAWALTSESSTSPGGGDATPVPEATVRWAS